MKFKTVATLAMLAASFTSALAQKQTFKIGNAGGMKVAQVFTVDSDADFENFTGQTHDVTGSVTFDPSAKTGSGKIVINLASLDTGIALRNEHMRSEMWMDTEKFPNATFETTSVRHLKGDKYEVSGKLTLRGVTRNLKTQVTVRYLKESESTRKAMFMGNVVQIKTEFPIKLAEFGVKIPDMAKGKVADTVKARLTVFAYSG